MHILLSLILQLLFGSVLVANEPTEEHERRSLLQMMAEPMTTINGCVSAVSGSYSQTGLDGEVSGCDPLPLGHFFCSGCTDERGFLARGWFTYFAEDLLVYQPLGIGFRERSVLDLPSSFLKSLQEAESPADPLLPRSIKNPTHVYLREAGGGKTLFIGTSHGNDMRLVVHRTGYTNTSGGAISGQHNQRNTKLEWHASSGCWEVTLGDGTRRIYSKNKHPRLGADFSYHHELYKLKKEIKASGNELHFGYNDDDELIRVATTGRDGTPEINWVTFHRKDKEKLVLETSDDHAITYRLEKFAIDYTRDERENNTLRDKSHRWLVTAIEPQHGPKTTFEYGGIPNEHAERIRKVCRGNYTLTNRYYKIGDNTLDEHTKVPIKKASDYKAYKLGKIRYQEAPVGPGNKEVVTHRYLYHKEGHDAEAGYTEVLDPYDNCTRYSHDECGRITSIVHYNAREQQRRAERFSWGKEKSSQEGNLIAHVVYDGNDTPILGKVYHYDAHHNVEREEVFGTFKGTKPGTIKVREGIPENDECDHLNLLYEYGKNNCKKAERDADENWTYYSYKEGTNLLAARFTCEKKEIRKREFFSYDATAACVVAIVDDGTSHHKDDLSGVHERHITYTKRRHEMPHYGAPEVITTYYWDADTKKEQLLSKMVNHFDKKGRVVKKEVYSAKDKLSGTAEFAYDKEGRLIHSRDPMGFETTTEYTDEGRVRCQRGPKKGAEVHYSYDAVGRTLKKRERWADTELETHYEYDLNGHLHKTIDPQGHVTTCSYSSLGFCKRIVFPKVLDETGTALHPEQQMGCDAAGNAVVTRNELGEETKRRYTARGQITYAKYPDGTEEHWEYDNRGYLVKEIAKNGLERHYDVDYQGRPTRIEEYRGDERLSKKVLHYNTFHLREEENSDGTHLYMHYDGAGRKAKVVIHGTGRVRRETRYRYNALGQVKEEWQILEEGKQAVVKKYRYDLLGRVTEEKLLDQAGRLATQCMHRYDVEGNRIETTSWSGDKECRECTHYHPHGRIDYHTDAKGNHTHYSYNFAHRNELGQRVVQTCVTSPSGVQEYREQDPLGRLVSVRCYAHGTLIAHQRLFYRLTGECARIVEENIVKGKSIGSVEQRIEYGKGGQKLAVIDAYHRSAERATRYTYTKYGELHTMKKPDGNVIEHSYDGKGRLQHIRDSEKTFDYRYSYDQGNRVIKAYDGRNYGAEVCTLHRTYDGLGNLLTRISHTFRRKSPLCQLRLLLR